MCPRKSPNVIDYFYPPCHIVFSYLLVDFNSCVRKDYKHPVT